MEDNSVKLNLNICVCIRIKDKVIDRVTITFLRNSKAGALFDADYRTIIEEVRRDGNKKGNNGTLRFGTSHYLNPFQKLTLIEWQ